MFLSMQKKNDIADNILILGIGNILLQDEGVGVHTIRELEKCAKGLPGYPDNYRETGTPSEEWPENIHLLDGGTGGFHMLSIVQEYKTIVMIDATIDNDPPGTIKVVEPRFASDFPKALSSHDIGLKDLVESATLLGFLPKIYLITVTIDQNQELGMELSKQIHNTIPVIIAEIKSILKQINHTN